MDTGRDGRRARDSRSPNYRSSGRSRSRSPAPLGRKRETSPPMAARSSPLHCHPKSATQALAVVSSGDTTTAAAAAAEASKAASTAPVQPSPAASAAALPSLADAGAEAAADSTAPAATAEAAAPPSDDEIIEAPQLASVRLKRPRFTSISEADILARMAEHEAAVKVAAEAAWQMLRRQAEEAANAIYSEGGALAEANPASSAPTLPNAPPPHPAADPNLPQHLLPARPPPNVAPPATAAVAAAGGGATSSSAVSASAAAAFATATATAAAAAVQPRVPVIGGDAGGGAAGGASRWGQRSLDAGMQGAFDESLPTSLFPSHAPASKMNFVFKTRKTIT
jgi:hypothetical protein